jgi:ATP-dependent helicase HrpA
MRLALKEQMRQIEKNLPGLMQAALALRGLAPAEDWKEDLLTAIADRAFIGEDELPRDAAAFEGLKQRARTRLPAVREAACRLFAAIAEEYLRAQQKLAATARSVPPAAADVRAQIARLVFKGFLAATPWDRLHDLPRYLKAAQLRLDKAAGDPERDQRHAGSIAELWRRYDERAARERRAGKVDPRVEDFRWRIEELRVSLYAQELKTPYPVSVKRLDKLWSQMRL